MANEITQTYKIQSIVGKNKGIHEFTALADQATPGSWNSFQDIGTSEEDITFEGVTAPGFVQFRNADDTNFVEIGKKVSGAMEKVFTLQPGQGCGGPMSSGITWRAKADTATVRIEKFATEAT